MDLVLKRAYIGQEGAFSTLAPKNGPPFAVTLEHTYEGNEAKVQPGTYTCRRTHFNRGGYDTFEVTSVPGHERILFHRGNTENDSDGCILLGLQFGPNGSVLLSINAMGLFMNKQSQVDAFELEVM
jgi:hypothetical protein